MKILRPSFSFPSIKKWFTEGYALPVPNSIFEIPIKFWTPEKTLILRSEIFLLYFPITLVNGLLKAIYLQL